MRFARLALVVCLLARARVASALDAHDWPRERLLSFAHELADFVFQNHVVTDPQRKTFGMTYEFWKDGKKVQEFGLNSMHDGAWFMSALVTMHRADPAGSWLAQAQKYQVPFYTNMLRNSDRLFPAMMPTETFNARPAVIPEPRTSDADDGSIPHDRRGSSCQSRHGIGRPAAALPPR